MRQYKDIEAGGIGELVGLVTELAQRGNCSPTELLERVSNLVGPEHPAVRRRRAVLAEFVSRIRHLRVRRNDLFGVPLFRDPAWDMLLELFVANERGEGLSVTSLCHASGVPLTTALRHLQRMEDYGLITRECHRGDSRLSIVRPTAQATARVSAIASMLLAEAEAWGPIVQQVDMTEPTLAERTPVHVWDI